MMTHYDGTPMNCQNRSDPDDEKSHVCGDEGRSMCPSCEAIRMAYWAGQFGLKPGMSREQRANMLDVMRPVETVTAQEWSEWRAVK